MFEEPLKEQNTAALVHENKTYKKMLKDTLPSLTHMVVLREQFSIDVAQKSFRLRDGSIPSQRLVDAAFTDVTNLYKLIDDINAID